MTEPSTLAHQQTATAAARDKIAEYWSRNVAGSDPFGPEVYWLAVPEVYAHYQARACRGTPYMRWFEYLAGTFLAQRGVPAERILSLGCGSGTLERKLWHLGVFSHCDAYDIAPGAIAIARRAAAELGATNIAYEVRDIQRSTLPQATYDAVWFNGSLHHIEQLEFVLGQVRRALKPGGYLLLNEYVGAPHFAFPEAQRQAITDAFNILPPRYRRSFAPGSDGAEMLIPPIPDPVAVRTADPSEGIRADEIIPLVRSLFDIVAMHNCGGSILQFLLCGLAGHFKSDDPEAMALLDRIMRMEDELIDSGALASDFVVMAALASE